MKVTMKPILNIDGQNIDLTAVCTIGDPILRDDIETYYTIITMIKDGVEVNKKIYLVDMLDVENNGIKTEADMCQHVRNVLNDNSEFSYEEKVNTLTDLKKHLTSIFPEGVVYYKGTDTPISFEGLHHNILIELMEDSWREKVVDKDGHGRYYNQAKKKVDDIIKLWVEYKDV